MAQDIPITRETIGNYQPLNAQYSTLPARLQNQVSAGLIDTSNQIAAQSQKSYLMGLSSTMKQELSRIEQENLGQPEAMEASMNKFKEGFFKPIMGTENAAIMNEQYASESMPYLRRAQTAKRERIDNDTATQGLNLVMKAKENILKNSSGLFSNDPGAVFDAGRNLSMQASSIEEVSKLTKSDGTPMFTPQQRATMTDIPDASLHDVAGVAWAMRPDNEKLAIAEQAMSGTGLPADKGADTVKPYTKERIQQVQEKVSQPSQYDDLFKEAAAQYGVDWKDLKTRAVVESGLDPKAVGPKTKYGQSAGLMQLTEETAQSLGVKDRTDPAQAIMGAAKLLAEHNKEAGGDKTVIDKLYYGGQDKGKWGPNTEQYAENMRAVRAGGAGETGTEFDYLSPAYKAKAFEEARDAINIKSMQYAPPEERRKIAEGSGSPKVMEAAVKIEQALKTDPAAYVASSLEAQASLQNYTSAPTPENFKNYLSVSTGLQKKMGVPDYALRVLPNSQAQGMVGEIMSSFSNNQDTHEKMLALQSQYGEFWPRAFQELQAAKLPPAAMVLGTMNHDTQRPFGKLLSQGITESKDDMVYKAAGPDAKKDIGKAIPGYMDNFRESTQRMQGGTQIIDGFQDAASILAAKLMQTQGISAGKAAERAVGILADDYYDYRGTYKVPKEFDGGDIARAADKTLGDLQGPLLFGSKAEYDNKAYLSSTKAFGYWVNTPEDDGIMLKDASGNYVRNADGGYVRYSYDQLQKMAAGAKASDKAASDAESKLRNANRGGM